MSFGSILIRWYHKNKRDLPWRNTKDPYKIWLSEVILQQTRVEQGLPYYLRFVERFPGIQQLAGAHQDIVLKLWQGLGYYSRARNLHEAARQVKNDFGGGFPRDYDAIRSLKGVGDYTAAAVASFAFDLSYPVVDGNVYRLLSRYFGIKTPINSTAGKKEFAAIAGKLIKDFPPATFNQAIMEFGAVQCKPSGPDCENCPLNSSCYAFEHGKVNLFPVKSKKNKTRNRYFYYLVIREQNSFYVRKRFDKDIWQGLHDFPLIETVKKAKEENLISSAEWKKIFGKSNYKIISISREHKHLLSHQTIYARFFEISLDKMAGHFSQEGWLKVSKKNFNRYAFPKLIERYLQENEI
jgi:A/G-specific adenine glycosylase